MLPRRACLSASAGLSCFEHVQNSSTSSTLMETIPRPYWFVLHSYYDVQVLTASIKFLGRGENVAECDGGLNNSYHRYLFESRISALVCLAPILKFPWMTSLKFYLN